MKLPKTYEPKAYESDIYDLWEKSEAFKPKARGSKEKYSIVLPPPNANGDLHVGHSFMFALQDVVIRYHRMKGDSTLWLPGADHAGFETQVVYEKVLAKQGKSRFDFSREELYKQIWDFVAQNKDNYDSQFRRLGASVDWDHYVYTLDDKIIDRSYKTFKKMWDEGLIYRGERLVNFCTFHGTGFADIEVEYRDVRGHLYYLKYPLTDGSGEVIVATTRPETMLGDVAVAVHPNDKRYKKFIGKTIKLPLSNREVPIVTDEFVDTAFGTGAVKITPAHDPNDFEVAQRHDLPMISVIDHEGKMSHEAPATYRGLTVEDARKTVLADLENQGFVEKIEDHHHSVGHCYKCGTVIQPLLREQWFVDMKPLAGPAIKTLRAGKIKFYPESKKDQLIKYLEGLRDWNISRQIAWGIPIPAFVNREDPQDWIYDEHVEKEEITVGGKIYQRDPDVFDTWFSSSSWPYATLDFPDSDDYKDYYPNSLMETGGEILYPWVSRMIMMGLYVTGKVPFETVYIHGYVLAEDGSKMSKSVGNVIDPMAEVDEYGSDALRMGLIAGRVPAVNRGYDPRRVEEARNFANKLWNVARFIEDKVGDEFHLKSNPVPKTAADAWILSKLQHSIREVGEFLDDYRFAEASDHIYHLLWDDLADWYIEASKVEPNLGVLAYALETILKLTHPFAPFVTETIWQTLKWEKGLLITTPWPKAIEISAGKAKEFEEVKSIVSEIRYITASLKVGKPNLYYSDQPFMSENAGLIKSLAGLGEIKQAQDYAGLRLISTKYEMWLDLSEQQIKQFTDGLNAKIAETEQQIKQMEGRLKNKAYIQKAPAELVKETKQQLVDAKELLAKQQSEFNQFSSL